MKKTSINKNHADKNSNPQKNQLNEYQQKQQQQWVKTKKEKQQKLFIEFIELKKQINRYLSEVKNIRHIVSNFGVWVINMKSIMHQMLILLKSIDELEIGLDITTLKICTEKLQNIFEDVTYLTSEVFNEYMDNLQNVITSFEYAFIKNCDLDISNFDGSTNNNSDNLSLSSTLDIQPQQQNVESSQLDNKVKEGKQEIKSESNDSNLKDSSSFILYYLSLLSDVKVKKEDEVSLCDSIFLNEVADIQQVIAPTGFHSLCKDNLLSIFSFLTRKELSIVSQVNKHLNILSNDKQFLKKTKIQTPYGCSRNTSKFDTKIIPECHDYRIYIWDFEKISPVVLKNTTLSAWNYSAVSPNNQYLAVGRDKSDSIDGDTQYYSSIIIWNLNSKREEKCIKLVNSNEEYLYDIKSLNFLSNVTLCVICEYQGDNLTPSPLLQIYNIDGSLNKEISVPIGFEFLNISKNKNWIVCQDSHSIYVYNNVNFSSEDSLILNATNDENCRRLNTIPDIRDVHITNNGKILVCTEKFNLTRIIIIYDIDQEQIIKKIFTQTENIFNLDLSNDGKYVVTTEEGCINIYDINKEKDQECICSLKFEKKWPKSVFFSYDNKGIVVFFYEEIQFIDFYNLGLEKNFVDEETLPHTSQLSM